MSESPPTEPERPDFTPFIETVYFEEWAPLGGPVALSLSPRCTVLVGRNGGGKSLLLEGLREGASGAGGLMLRVLKVAKFRVDVRVGGSTLLHYEYEHKASGGSPRASRGESAAAADDWRESCWLKDREQPLWSTAKGVLSLNTKETFHLGGAGGSLLAVGPGILPAGQAAASRQLLSGLLMGVRSVEPLMPVRRHGREAITLKGDSGVSTIAERLAKANSTTANKLADALWELFEERRAEFNELEAVGERIGIWQKLNVETYVDKRGRSADVLAEITIDGVNLGLASDGTLRLLNILLELVVSPHLSAPLLIDEPELGIHPGLLALLLNEFEAYGAGRQLVIATHSPQVVSWARPDALRLVERLEGRTVVRSLSKEQAERVHDYLQDHGNLGEFVYGGGVDD